MESILPDIVPRPKNQGPINLGKVIQRPVIPSGEGGSPFRQTVIRKFNLFQALLFVIDRSLPSDPGVVKPHSKDRFHIEVSEDQVFLKRFAPNNEVPPLVKDHTSSVEDQLI